MSSLREMVVVVLLGAGATAVMDAWLTLLKRIGVRTLDLALVGRWIGHLGHGTFAHDAIAHARPIRAERALGWLTHYLVGIAFAGALVAIAGNEWTRRPTLLPALAFGVATVLLPLFVMQPAMGAGFAGSRTKAPLQSCLRSLANHTVFGLGLYLTAVLVAAIAP